METSESASHRHDKLSSEIRSAIQQVFIHGLSDPRMEGSMLTVTSVELTQDSKTAFVGVSVLPEKHETRVKAGLNHCSKFIRRAAGDLVRTNVLPQFNFHIDTSLKKQAKIMAALAKVQQEQQEKEEAAEKAAGGAEGAAGQAEEASGQVKTGGAGFPPASGAVSGA